MVKVDIIRCSQQNIEIRLNNTNSSAWFEDDCRFESTQTSSPNSCSDTDRGYAYRQLKREEKRNHKQKKVYRTIVSQGSFKIRTTDTCSR